MKVKTAPSKIAGTLTLLLRAERLIAARRMAIFRNQTSLMALAGLFVAVAIVMLNVAAYFGLSDVMPDAWAALFVALGNLVLAGIFILFASRLGHEHQLATANEMRDMALEDLEGEVDDLVEDVRGTTQDLRRFARDPLGTVLPSLLSQILKIIMASGHETEPKTTGSATPDETNTESATPETQPPAQT
ncbi:MAG: phage holin family protein [Pseudomonadota bacterium]